MNEIALRGENDNKKDWERVREIRGKVRHIGRRMKLEKKAVGVLR